MIWINNSHRDTLHFFQWRQADSIRHLGKVTLAQEQDYTGLIVGCVCVSLLLLLLGTLLMWRRNKHIDGKRLCSGCGGVEGHFTSLAATYSETSDILNSALIWPTGIDFTVLCNVICAEVLTRLSSEVKSG